MDKTANKINMLDLMPSKQTLGDIHKFQKRWSVEEWLRRSGKIMTCNDMPRYIIPSSDEGREIIPGFTIHRVTLANLSKVQNVLKVIFPDEMAHFQVAFAAVAKPFYDTETHEAVLRAEQYVLIEKVSGDLAATWGAYYKEDDKDVAIWADYMGVHPAFQKRGLGQKMVKYALKMTLQAAIESKRRFIRLYTEDVEFEFAARKIYNAVGFKVYKTKQLENLANHNRIWMQLDLDLGKTRF
eukprot:CAMPEP_0178953792 /NCGR_PEP_ID=MMETSP0789-20121207/8618_1 /TAXON_ID=3005 /ORGANISM="Rhizosolenia setigera, Strain CCMP 1694" /LENGTH=239 /DNA_ID=CAMNT_0020635095 /DNA_START=175 /DNA_END=894 /DNA_ORIENTATION=+